MTEQARALPLSEPMRAGSDSGLASVARIYDALRGGEGNYAADRVAAARLEGVVPGAADAAQANREFVGRSVRYLARRGGIGQFLDIGSGLPAARGAVHQVAWLVRPGARVAYADNDPDVVRELRAAHHGLPNVAVVEGDVRYPRVLLTERDVRSVIDFRRPVAVLLTAVLHFVPDSDHPYESVFCITNRLAPGSYLVISHVTGDEISTDAVEEASRIYNGALVRGAVRSRIEVRRFFAGLEMSDPGLVDVAAWCPGHEVPALPGRPVLFWAGLGRKKEASQ